MALKIYASHTAHHIYDLCGQASPLHIAFLLIVFMFIVQQQGWALGTVRLSERGFADSSVPVERHPLGLQHAGPPPLLTPVDRALGLVKCKEET